MSPENAQYVADNVLSQPLDGDYGADGTFHVAAGAGTGHDAIRGYVDDANTETPSATAKAYSDTTKDYGIRERPRP